MGFYTSEIFPNPILTKDIVFEIEITFSHKNKNYTQKMIFDPEITKQNKTWQTNISFGLEVYTKKKTFLWSNLIYVHINSSLVIVRFSIIFIYKIHRRQRFMPL